MNVISQGIANFYDWQKEGDTSKVTYRRIRLEECK
jgi:hypothetical protein